ncbi:MAG: response regulator [Burkholderiales bacterium]|nr:response regulator [Anaerolineae bacterium]
MQELPVILYVEDEAHSRKVMRLLANDIGVPQITIFEDSVDFMERVEALDPKPDLIFLDIHLKPYTGFEMLQMLRESRNFSDTLVVAITASVMNEEVQQLRVAGFDGCLAKPIDMDTFPDTLQRIMNREEIWRILG